MLWALLLGSGTELRAQSEAVVVRSATDSEIVVATLMTAEGGGFTLNGEAFTGGSDNPVTDEGGRIYVLTLAADGSWSAAFLPMEVPVALGASGDSVTLMTTEAGGYTLDGAAVADASMAMNSVGENYALTMGADGVWMATHQPMEATVTLGSSGGNVMLMTDEAGRWTLDGDSFSSGQTV